MRKIFRKIYYITYKSARHSIRIDGLSLLDNVAEVEVDFSSSARTATMTAAIS